VIDETAQLPKINNKINNKNNNIKRESDFIPFLNVFEGEYNLKNVYIMSQINVQLLLLQFKIEQSFEELDKINSEKPKIVFQQWFTSEDRTSYLAGHVQSVAQWDTRYSTCYEQLNVLITQKERLMQDLLR